MALPDNPFSGYLLEVDLPDWQDIKSHPDFHPQWALIFLKRKKAIAGPALIEIYRDQTLRRDYKVRCALVAQKNLPQTMFLTLVTTIRWGDLLNILRLPYLSARAKHGIETFLKEKFEDLTLGEKIAFARKANRPLIPMLCRKPEREVLNALFSNPYFTFQDAQQMATRAKTTPTALTVLAQTPKWRRHKEIAMALLKNPKLPRFAVMDLLKNLTPFDCQLLRKHPTTPIFVKRIAEKMSK